MNFYIKSLFRLRRGMLKTLVVMKIIVLLLTTAILQVSASSFGQNVTLKQTNAKLAAVLDDIQTQTGYGFVYNDHTLSKANLVNIDVKNMQLKQALLLCFKGQPLTFEISNKIVTVKEAVPSFLDGLVGSITADRFDLIDVKGKVVNQNNETLPGALIKIKGTNRAAIADANGNFAIQKVDDKATLVISYIGYESQEVKAAPSMGYITLKPTTNALDQVVVQGYGTTTDRLRTGNIATVSAKDIEKQPVNNVLQALQGKVPGLIITQKSGYASAPFKVELRGRTAINGNMIVEPLYIIDGVPFDMLNIGGNSSYQGGSPGVIQNGMVGPARGQSPLFNINPSDIESISIMKDADALAIYGSKGANGVILINTKKGQAGRTKFDLELDNGVSVVTRQYDMLNTQQYIAMRKEAFKNSGIIPNQSNAFDILVWDTTRYTDLQKLYWGDPARRLNLQFGLSGGEKNTSFRLAGSLLKSTMVNTYSGGDKRMGMQLNLNHKNLEQRLNISFNGFLNYSNVDLINLGGSVTAAPNIPAIFNENGQLNYSGYAPATYLFGFARLLQPYTAKTILLNTNLKVLYQLAKGLNISTNLGYSTTRNDQLELIPIASQNPQFNPRGSASFGDNNRTSLIFEPQIDYKLALGKGEINALIGTTFQNTNVDGKRANATGYVNDNLLRSISNAPTVGAMDAWGQYRYSGIFTRINYNYQNKYIANFSARRDGSSRFGPGRQFGNFGSVGLAWIFTEERWLKNEGNFLSFGKLRISYGITGSDNIGDYLFLSNWGSYYRSYQANTPAYVIFRHFNPDLQWQSDKKLDGGVNIGILKNKLNLDLAFYKNRVGNQLLEYSLPYLTGFGNVVANFPAVVENKGFELTVTSKVIDREKWSWNVNFNIGLNRNKLVEFPGIESSPYASEYVVGKSINLTRTLKYTGLDSKSGQYTFEDVNGDGIINASMFDLRNSDMTKLLDLSEEFDGGFGSTFRYESLQLDLNFHYRKQTIKKSNAYIGVPGSLANISAEFLDRWQKPGDNTKYARFTVLPAASDNHYYMSDEVYKNMYFVRLNNASLSYSIPQTWAKKIGANSALVNIRAQNLLTITNFEGIDPEIPVFGIMPTLTTVMFGIQLKF